MEFLKKHWMQGLTLGLCAVLIAVVVTQGFAISALREELVDSRQEMDALSERLDETAAALETVQKAQNAPLPSVCFTNASVNTADRVLTVDILGEIPRAAGNYLSIGLCAVGEPYRAAWRFLYLERQADGTYTGTVTFPLNLDMGIELRLEDNTVLYSAGSVTALLPVQLAHGGASWHYNSTLQKFYILDCVPGLTNLEGGEAQVTDGLYRVYRNGELVVEDSYFGEGDGAFEHEFFQEGFAVPCAPGDHIRLCYVCTDAFGLRYEFPLGEWAAQRWDDAVSCPLSAEPTVTWPE